MPPPRPPPYAHRGCHGAWRWRSPLVLRQPPHLAVKAPASTTTLTSAVALATATAPTSTLSIIRRTLFLAGVWGEASPQAPPEGAGGAREEAQAPRGGERKISPGGGGGGEKRGPGSSGRREKDFPQKRRRGVSHEFPPVGVERGERLASRKPSTSRPQRSSSAAAYSSSGSKNTIWLPDDSKRKGT